MATTGRNSVVCPRCGYDPATDKASPETHKLKCRPSGGTSRLDYTAAPMCETRWAHKLETWCDTCDGVA